MKHLTVVLLLPLLACAAKKPAQPRPVVDIEIPPACAVSIIMRDCDVNAHPPKCQSTAIRYKASGCETIVLH